MVRFLPADVAYLGIRNLLACHHDRGPMRLGYCFGSKEAHCPHWWEHGGKCCHCQETGADSLARQTKEYPQPAPRWKTTPCADV
jgi:hypothetical protein